MKKISSNATSFHRNIFPWVFLAFLVFLVVSLLYTGVYLALAIFLPVVIIKAITTRLFFAQRHLSEVWLDASNQLFGVNDFKSKFTLPFGELYSVKVTEMNKLFKLVFKNRTIYFTPKGSINLLVTNRELKNFLDQIVRNNRNKKGSPVSQ
jgi:hypothetical protein